MSRRPVTDAERARAFLGLLITVAAVVATAFVLVFGIRAIFVAATSAIFMFTAYLAMKDIKDDP